MLVVRVMEVGDHLIPGAQTVSAASEAMNGVPAARQDRDERG